jgi:hypothetical protein
MDGTEPWLMPAQPERKELFTHVVTQLTNPETVAVGLTLCK